MNAGFFGSDSTPLFGVHHSPRRTVDQAKCVVLCPPIGQEYLRTHWALRLIANQLTRKGFHVLRFDYRGLGDSSGEPFDVKSIDEWRCDIETAVDFLKETTGAETVMLFGLRTGASLAAEVTSVRTDVHSLVAWEPIYEGREYLDQLREVHQTMIDLWWQEVRTVNDASFEELLGTRYQRDLIQSIEQWTVDFDTLEVPQLIVELESSPSERPRPDWQKRVQVDDDNSWCKLSDLEVAWLRPKTSQQIVQQIGEMFTRLEQRDMLAGAIG
ncbi:MAG: alpha/beta fold hydrolase [Planctomycetota bacterium]